MVHRGRGCCFAAAGAAAVAATHVGADVLAVDLSAIAIAGDQVRGVGAIVSIRASAVNSFGHSLLLCQTDADDENHDVVVLADGILTLTEGDPLPAPSGALIDYFDSFNLNNNGGTGWNFGLSNVPAGFDSGVYLNTTLLVQEGDPSAAAGFDGPVTYYSFLETAVNDLNEIALIAEMDDAEAVGVKTTFLVITQSITGGLKTEQVVVREGMTLPGQSEPIAELLPIPHSFDLSNAGQTMCVVDLAGDELHDGGVLLGGTLLAQEGTPSPVSGRLWGTLGPGTAVDLNHAGDYVLRAKLAGDTQTDDLIVVNGLKFKQAGDTVPGVPGVSLVHFGAAGPVRIDDAGNVFWYGCWTDPNPATDCGLFRNEQLLIREGISDLDGVIFGSISAESRSFTISDDGRNLVFEATLSDGRDGAFLLKFLEPCAGDCADNNGRVNITDLLQLLTEWGGPGGACDIDGNGVVNVFDLLALLADWGDC
jgi:hypothetical protein